MRALIALASLAQFAPVLLASADAATRGEPPPQKPKEPDMIDNRRAAQRADFEESTRYADARRDPFNMVTEGDRARWDAERQAKRAAKAARALAIRDAQLARGQRTA